MTEDEREQRIRERAYFIWIDDGRPHGFDKEHWKMAERELAGEDAELKPGERASLPNPFAPTNT